MSIAAKCTCGKSLTYCVSGCPYEETLEDLGLHIQKPIIDWDAIEKEFKKQMWATPSQFNWFKEQVSKYVP